MNTLVEYKRLATDDLKAGIIDTIVKESPLLELLPWEDIVGNALAYNLEDTLAGAGWFNVGGTWTESAPTWAQRTTELKILGGDADIDKFIQQTRTQQNVGAAIIELKAKAIAHEFEKQAIFGGTTVQVNASSIKGLMLLLAECESSSTTDWDGPNNGQVVTASSTSATLTMDMLDELIDAVKPRPDILLCSRRTRRKISALGRASGSILRETHSDFGHHAVDWDGVPVLISDWVPDNLPDASASIVTLTSYDQTTTRAGGSDNSVIFAISFGPNGVSGLQNGGIQTEPLGTLETKDASRTRIKWYGALANFGTLKLGGLINFTDGS